MSLFPAINANYFSWSDIELQFLTPTPLLFAGVKAINYDDNLTRKLVYGTAAQPIGLTKGKYEPKGDIELWLPQANLLISTMPLWRQVPVTITIAYVSSGPLGLPAPGLPQPVIVDTIPNCYLTSLAASQTESDSALSRKFGLTITGQILWGGLPSFLEPIFALAVA